MTDPKDINILGARTWVVHPYRKHVTKGDTSQRRDPENRLEECINLCDAIELEVIGSDIVPLRTVNPSTFIGKGKLGELRTLMEEEQIELCVFDCTLSPIQQRELEKAIKVKVIDRTELILEIFGERAATKEGVLQVELAALEYQKSRLVRSWTHLERQRGGFGFMGGPGERQIESDRRVINDRIAKIKKELETVTKTRELHRKNRRAIPYPIVALVGYTNAGKSTLFNRLTNATVFAEDLLFATLDPTMRELILPSGRKVILSDTVGFISDLPTQLIAAFRATLEEVLEADVILHVRDAASPDTAAQKQDVLHVLDGLGINREDKPIIEVMNKSDLLSKEEVERIHANKRSDFVLLSAQTGHGNEDLLQALDAHFASLQHTLKVTLPASDGKRIAWLHAHAEEVETVYEGEQVHISCLLSAKRQGEWEKIA